MDEQGPMAGRDALPGRAPSGRIAAGPSPVSRSRSMARLLSRFDVMRRAEEQASEMRLAEGRLMWLLTSEGPPLTLKQIATELELEQSTANRQVNAAVRAHLVRRFREPGTHAWLFEATAHGLELYERSLRRHLVRIDDALASLPQDEQERLLHAFATFIDAYRESAEADATADDAEASADPRHPPT